MTGVTQAKLGIAAAALLVFVAGVRMDSPGFRWAAVAMLLAAFLLRFYRTRE